MFRHSTQKTLGRKLKTRKDRGYVAKPNISRNQRGRTPDTDVTRVSGSEKQSRLPSVAGQGSLILEEYTNNQAHEQPLSVYSSTIPENLPPIDQFRRPGSKASVESTPPSHASANSCSPEPSLVDQSDQSCKGRSRIGRGRAIVEYRERTERRLDEDPDDENESTKCCLCQEHFGGTNRYTCGDRGSSKPICSGCLLNPNLFSPGHKFRQGEDQAPGAAACPSQGVPIRSESCRLPAYPIQYRCNYCEVNIAIRNFCEWCKIDLCKECLELHPPEHHVKTDPEVFESEVVQNDSLNWGASDTDDSSASDDQTELDGPRQGQREPERRSKQWQSLARQWTPLTIPEKLPEQLLLAKLLEQSGETVAFSRKDVMKMVRDIQDLRHRLALIGRAKGVSRHVDALPSTKRSVPESPGIVEVCSDISMRDSALSDSENSENEEPAPDRGLRARKRGGLRDLLDFKVPQSEPRRCDEPRQHRRWTPKDNRLLEKLKREGWDNQRIAAELNRSPAAISQQWAKQKQ